MGHHSMAITAGVGPVRGHLVIGVLGGAGGLTLWPGSFWDLGLAWPLAEMLTVTTGSAGSGWGWGAPADPLLPLVFTAAWSRGGGGGGANPPGQQGSVELQGCGDPSPASKRRHLGSVGSPESLA